MNNDKRGFTLIELLVVIAIMLLIIAIAMPGISQFLRSRTYNQAAQQVHSAFMRARSRAITQREIHYVVIFTKDAPVGSGIVLPRPSGGTKEITGDKNTMRVIDSNEKQSVVAKELVEAGDTLILPETVKFDERYPNFHVEFFYDGSCSIQGKTPADAVSTNLLYKNIPVGAPKPMSSSFDLIVTSPEEKVYKDSGGYRRVYIDIVQGTGALKFRVYPK